MSKIKTFWYTFINSFTSLSYYKNVLKAPLSFSLKFYFAYFFLFAAVLTVFITKSTLIPLNKQAQKLPSIITKSYPQELVVTIRNGEVSTNVVEPYYVKNKQISNLFGEARNDALNDKNILVIDTKASIEDYEQYHTSMLLTKNYLVFARSNGRLEVNSLKSMPDTVINQKFVNTFSLKITEYIKKLSPFIIPFVLFTIFIFLSISTLVYLSFLTVILWILSKILSITLAYNKLYQIGLHILVVITTIVAVFERLTPIRIPFFELILFTIIGVLILNNIKPALSQKKSA